MSLIRFLPLAALTLPPAWGQLALTSNSAVERALQNNQLIAVSEARIASLQGLRLQAGVRPNPRFFFQTENMRTWGSPGFEYWNGSDTFFYLSQVLETAGKRNRRIQAADANVERGRLERELAAFQITLRVRQAYWAALGAHRSARLLEDTARSFEQTVTYHENRVREGAMAEVDLIRVRLEAERLRIAVNAASLEADRARIRLLQEMGETEFPQLVFQDDLTAEAKPPALNVDQALANRPELRIARQAIAQAETQVARQQAGARPDVEVLGGYKRTAGFDTLIAGMQVNVPLNDRNRGNIAAAEAEVRIAQRTQAAQEAVVRAEVQAAQADYDMRRRQLAETLDPMRQRAQDAARIAAAAYREGGTDLLRLLDAERLRIETELLYVRTLAEFRQSVVALEAALGVLR